MSIADRLRCKEIIQDNFLETILSKQYPTDNNKSMNILNEQAMILSEASLLQICYLDRPSIEMAKICKHCFCSCKQNKVRHLEMVQKMQPCQLGLSIREDKTHL
jgi:hypothetical protein